MQYYLSLQFSAIQKTLLRHDRLWSIAGTSQIMAWMNEISMPSVETGMSRIISGLSELLTCDIAQKSNAKVLVAEGGKFTARFADDTDAEEAKKDIIRLISTTLPMLEFQVSEVVPASSLKEARTMAELNGKDYPGLVHELDEQKRCFRGYGLTFNPHVKVCEECGEYPAVAEKCVKTGVDEKGRPEFKGIAICSICDKAKHAADIKLRELNKNEDRLTTLEKIYLRFVESLSMNDDEKAGLNVPMNFEDLFPDEDTAGKEGKQKRRIAVWASDVNGMGDKVTVWLNQEEGKIYETFEMVKEINTDFVSNALIATFKDKNFVEKEDENGEKKQFIPFRLVVAGGDDLCIVMKDKDILSFVSNLSNSLHGVVQKIGSDHPLNIEWLKKKQGEQEKSGDKENKPKTFRPHSFGGSFVVAPLHTPFKKIHNVAEELMSEAKKKTCRMENSVNWMTMSADEEPVSESLIAFEKPLFIDIKPDFAIEKCLEEEPKPEAGEYLTFCNYLEMVEEYKNLSGSHIQQIVSKIIEFRKEPGETSERLEKWLKGLPAAAKKNSEISRMLRDDRLRTTGKPDHKRIATLLELMSI
jgi:hypothetical protein